MGDRAEDIDVAQIAALMFKELTSGGPHAFGWMNWSDGDEAVQYQSREGRADSLGNLEYIYETVKQNPRWFVGHTRWATHGSPKNNANNHPILHGDVIGVHNGVLRNHESILKVTGRQDPTAEVDSEAIFAAVNKYGALEGIRKIDGDLVSIWNDLSDMETLYIARSEGRFLHIGITDRGNLIFASQPGAIEALHPLVRIVKWSTVAQQKLLTIKGGKIITRQQIRKPSPAKPPNVWAAGMSKSATGNGSTEFFEARGVGAQKRGSRRGESMFPKSTIQQTVSETLETTKPVKKTRKKAAPQVKEVTERWVPDLGMIADQDDNLRLATAAEVEFFTGSAKDADALGCENLFDWKPEDDLPTEADDPTLEWEGEANPLTEVDAK